MNFSSFERGRPARGPKWQVLEVCSRVLSASKTTRTTCEGLLCQPWIEPKEKKGSNLAKSWQKERKTSILAGLEKKKCFYGFIGERNEFRVDFSTHLRRSENRQCECPKTSAIFQPKFYNYTSFYNKCRPLDETKRRLGGKKSSPSLRVE